MKKSAKILLLVALFFILFPELRAQLKPYEEIGEMIKQNITSIQNPTYKLPSGNLNLGTYLTSAISVGDAVSKPLAYLASSPANNYYVNYSLRPAVFERGKSFNLVLTSNKIASTAAVHAYVFADWDRDGVFEVDLGKHSIPDRNIEVAGVSLNVSIPEDAKLGKSRIRIYFTTYNTPSMQPDANLRSGTLYDFVVFVSEKTEQTKLLLNVSSNNIDFGNAVILTESATADGRYDAGTSVEIEAICGPKSVFVGWSNGTKIVSTSQNYKFTLTEHTHLIALFNAPTVTLEEPQPSTADNPIWYQIKNAQTDSRIDRFIAYTETIPEGYTTALRIEKPADLSDKFLWRLEPTEDDMVKLVNKGSGKQIYSATGDLNTSISVADEGSSFFVTPSGHSNGSYSIKWNNQNDKLLNGGLAFNIVLYNAGIGTGSGWYFYRVPIYTSTPTTIENSNIKFSYSQNTLRVQGLENGAKIDIYNILGHKVLSSKANTDEVLLQTELKGVHIVTVSDKNGYKTVKKILF